MRPVLSMTLCAAIGAACAEPDTTYGDPGAIATQKLPTSGSGGASGTAGGSSDAPDPFGGPYSATANPAPPTVTLKAGHAAGAGPDPTQGPIADCLTCHIAGGQAATKLWAVGGQVLGGKPNVDVVVTDSKGKNVGPAKSDADGYFWIPAGSVSVEKGMRPILRNGSGSTQMVGPLDGPPDGGCNQGGMCHGGTEGLAGSGLK